MFIKGKRGLTEDIPIDGELEVTTSTDERSLLKPTKSKQPTDHSNEDDGVLYNYNISESSSANRKYKDMMRKRQLRQSAEYRQQETVSSRNRMKMRRSNPAYREKERERDRERRRLARSNNPEKRAIERERDRLYKKRLRDDSKGDFVVNSVSHEIILFDSSSNMVIETVEKESE